MHVLKMKIQALFVWQMIMSRVGQYCQLGRLLVKVWSGINVSSRVVASLHAPITHPWSNQLHFVRKGLALFSDPWTGEKWDSGHDCFNWSFSAVREMEGQSGSKLKFPFHTLGRFLKTGNQQVPDNHTKGINESLSRCGCYWSILRNDEGKEGRCCYENKASFI